MNTKYNNRYNLLGTIEPFSIKKEGFKNLETLLYQMVAGAGFEPTTFGL